MKAALTASPVMPWWRRGPFRSIRWTLQLWHAGLLALVLVGFGTAAFVGMERMTYQEVDDQLEHTVQLVAASVRPVGPPDRGGQPDRGGPLERGGGRDFRGRAFDGGAGTQPGGMGFDAGPDAGFGGPDGHGPDGHGHGPGDRGPGDRGPGGPGFGGPGGGWRGPPPVLDVDLPPAVAAHFASESADAPYYIVWNGEGQVVKASRMVEGLEPPGVSMAPPFRGSPEPPRLREREGLHEAWMGGPFGARVLVGQSVVVEDGALRQLALLLAATGAGVLLIGLAGGWMVSRRAVRPISAMSGVAGDISATHLSRRIDPEQVPSELRELAGVLNEMFSRLEAAFQQQIRFTADASHELRTPLAVIHTHTQLALSRERSAEEYKKTLATCFRASTRMKGLVDSLLLLAGADAGRLSLEHERFDLKDVVEDCVLMVSTMAAERNIAVSAELQPAEVVGDAARVGQVVTNLLTNAIRYNREGGTVRVTVVAEGQEAVVRVEDTGVGIPEEHQGHVFERFYRVDAARSREAGGNGLGLAICKSIVEAHGGRIEVQSSAGEGTTFTVRLPREAGRMLLAGE